MSRYEDFRGEVETITPAKQGADDKFPINLTPPEVTLLFALVSQSGIEKGYNPCGWDGKGSSHGMTPEVPLGALKRHLAKHELGEECDKETGLPHLFHIAWNGMVSAIRSMQDRSPDAFESLLKELKAHMKTS